LRKQFADSWSDWFEGLTIHTHPDGEMTLSGPLADQAALFGVLEKTCHQGRIITYRI
jgi:hypothetical protein